MKMKTINIKAIQTDGGTQSRTAINESVVADYCDALVSGAEFPPVCVFFDGAEYWLADGFHRFHAHNKAGRASIVADVRDGTKRDAVLFSLGANHAHGLRRSSEDKRKAVETMLADDEWATWPHSRIAANCAVTREYVSRVASKMGGLSCDRSQDSVRVVERNGATFEQQTANIGKSRAPAKAPKSPAFAQPVPSDADQELAEARHTIAELAQEVEQLTDRLAVESMDASEDAKSDAAQIIAELRAQVANLERELQAMRLSRDAFQDENAQLKRQVAINSRLLQKQVA